MHYIADMTVQYIYGRCKFPVPTGPNFVVDNMIKVFDTFVQNWKSSEEGEPHKVPSNAEEIMMNALIFAFVWGVGAQIDENTRSMYDLFLQEIIQGEDVNNKHKLEQEKAYPEVMKIKTNLGSDYQSLFDMSFVPGEVSWVNWMKT